MTWLVRITHYPTQGGRRLGRIQNCALQLKMSQWNTFVLENAFYSLHKYLLAIQGAIIQSRIVVLVSWLAEKRCPSHIQIYYSEFKDPTDIFSLSLNASHFLNQLDESICFECLLLAPVKDSPCAGNDCTLQCGYSVPRWFECIISIINTSVAFEDFFFVKQSSARSKSTVFPPFYLTACVMNMNSASTT